jgi:hypothetical protein
MTAGNFCDFATLEAVAPGTLRVVSSVVEQARLALTPRPARPAAGRSRMVAGAGWPVYILL